MYNPPSSDAETWFSYINDLFVHMRLNFENVRKLSFDGVANMSGRRHECKNEFRKFYFHSLDLALCDTIKTVDLANDTRNLVRFVSITILDSAKRKKNVF